MEPRWRKKVVSILYLCQEKKKSGCEEWWMHSIHFHFPNFGLFNWFYSLWLLIIINANCYFFYCSLDPHDGTSSRNVAFSVRESFSHGLEM